ncbi:hypothetical protein E3N86_00080 [Cryobacterium sp. Hz7]|uniref:hypothetical protein n=1 Tax=Cryobacterium sp. Hz7 TaxID=1259166 RepID=UPI00106ADA82|nr:hypothetical protein [Cryobacterium sp. Hz7]TFB67207.1 hypothetical protein E3N86_00080 [Cryobacterium sp. Hz7]
MKTRVDHVDPAEVRGNTFAVHTAGSDDPAQHDFLVDGEHDRVRLGGFGQWLHVLDTLTLRVGEQLVVRVAVAGSVFVLTSEGPVEEITRF